MSTTDINTHEQEREDLDIQLRRQEIELIKAQVRKTNAEAAEIEKTAYPMMPVLPTMEINGSSIAIEIATKILTVDDSSPIECTRAGMMLTRNGKEFELAGRNKQSIVSCIDQVLKEHGFTISLL